MNWAEKILYYQLLMLITITLNLLWAFPVKWAWNYTMPYIFELPEIGWGKAFAILFIMTSLWKLNITTVQNDKD